jgi:hypothetical protein
VKIGDLVKYKVPDDTDTGEQIGVIVGLRRNSMNSSDKYTTYHIYWPDLGNIHHTDHSALEVINESG